MSVQQLILENQGLAHRAAAAVTNNPRYREDVHAAALIGLIEAAKSYNPDLGIFSSWAWRQAYGRAVRQLEHLTKLEHWDDTIPDRPGTEQPVPEQAIANLITEHVRTALAKLPDRERHIVSAVHGINHPETTIADIARSMNLSRQRVSALYHNGLKMLQKALPADTPR